MLLYLNFYSIGFIEMSTGRVIYDFQAQGTTQLSLKCGTMIKIIQKGESGGW